MRRYRQRTFEILERNVSGSRASVFVNGILVSLILGSVLAVILESNRELSQAYGEFFWKFEVLVVAVFTVEYLLRVWISVDLSRFRGIVPWKARLRYLFTTLAVIDFVAIAPFYLQQIIPLDLRFVRVLRLLRLLKLSHFFPLGLGIFMDVLRAEGRTLGSVFFTIFVLLIVTACIMFSVEHKAQPEAFADIADAFWWAVVTMTTVGYGDVTPVTSLGKVIAVFIMLLGVGLVALPAAMLAAKFAEEIRTRNRTLEARINVALVDGPIDDNAMRELQRLSETMGISESSFSNLLEQQTRQRVGVLLCPHCGKQFSARQESAVPGD